MQLGSYVKILPATTLAQGAAGTGTVTGMTIDTLNFAAGLFVIPIGTITAGAVTSVRLQHGHLANLSDVIDGTSASNLTIADTASGGVAYLDVRQFTRRYVRLSISRATQNSSFGVATCFLYESVVSPTIHPAGVFGKVAPSSEST